MKALFEAYDLTDAGVLSRDAFIKIEMRLAFESNEVYKADAGAAKMTLSDRDSDGVLDYDEFRTRCLTQYTELGYDRTEVVSHANKQIQLAVTERARMGPRFYAGIRRVLKQLFDLFDSRGDGKLSPDEWIAAQKAVAFEITDVLDEGWIDEAAFVAADIHKNGVLELDEFLEASFVMFETIRDRSDSILATLRRAVKVVEKERAEGKKETPPVMVYVQSDEKPEFWSPPDSEANSEKIAERWATKGELALPLNMNMAEDVASLLRLHCQTPPDMWVSVFYSGPPEEDGSRPVILLRGNKPTDGNTAAMLQYFCKPNAELKIFVKNARKRPTKLIRQPRAFLEERERMLAKRTGQSWGIDWDTQLTGDGYPVPPRPLQIKLGEALVVEVPQSAGSSTYPIVSSVYMDRDDVLSKPVDESIAPKAAKKKKPGQGEPDPLVQLSFIALKEGKSVLFVDVSWEDQEEKLAKGRKVSMPVFENSVGRIGPIEVEVISGKGGEKGTFTWWNGEKWTGKKGPAKRKKKKR